MNLLNCLLLAGSRLSDVTGVFDVRKWTNTNAWGITARTAANVLILPIVCI